jgi:hypothetical protein
LILLALSLAVAPATAQEAPPLVLDAALADAPVEAALTVAALRQLETQEKGRVSHALYQLEALLALPGFRRQAVTEALEQAGALKILESSASWVKGKALKELRARLEEQIRERVGVTDGAAAVDLQRATLVERPELVWNDVGTAERKWWSVPVEADRELEVHIQGCDYAHVALFDDGGRRVGAEHIADTFTPARLWATSEVSSGHLRVRRGGGCDEDFRVAVVARQAPVALRGHGSPVEPERLQVGEVYRVRPAGGSAVHFVFDTEPGGVYVVRTEDLEGRTDTSVALLTPEGRRIVDDDAGNGLASAVRFDTLLADEVHGAVSLLQAGPDTSFRLTVDEAWRYEVAETAALEGPWRLSGAAWNGHVVPLTFDGDSAVVEFQASKGGVYGFHTALDVSVQGQGDVGAMRLVGEDLRPPGSVRPVHSFLALENGRFKATLTRTPETEDGAVFFQFLTTAERRPVPHISELGTSRKAALRLTPGDHEYDFDGGVLDELEPGEDGWVRFKVRSGSFYRLYVDGTDRAGALTARVVDEGDGEVLLDGMEPAPRAEMLMVADNAGVWSLHLENAGERANHVRVAVIAEQAYGGFRIGDRVKVGRHRPFEGFANWVEPMERYVGRSGTIMDFAGRDASGAWVVRLDIDDSEFAWRTRDLDLVQRASAP